MKLTCIRCHKRVARVPVIVNDDGTKETPLLCGACTAYVHYKNMPDQFLTPDEYVATLGGGDASTTVASAVAATISMRQPRQRRAVQRSGFCTSDEIDEYMVQHLLTHDEDDVDLVNLPADLDQRLRAARRQQERQLHRLEKKGKKKQTKSAGSGGGGGATSLDNDDDDATVSPDILDQLWDDLGMNDDLDTKTKVSGKSSKKVDADALVAAATAGARDYKDILANILGTVRLRTDRKRRRRQIDESAPLDRARQQKKTRQEGKRQRVEAPAATSTAGAASADQKPQQEATAKAAVASRTVKSGDLVMIDMGNENLHPAIVVEPYVDDVDDDASTDAPQPGKHKVSIVGSMDASDCTRIVHGVYTIDTHTRQLTLV